MHCLSTLMRRCLHSTPSSLASHGSSLAHSHCRKSMLEGPCSKLRPSEYTHARAADYLRQFDGGGVSLSPFRGLPDVACIRLDNPPRKNALSGRMMAEFGDVVDQLQKEHSHLRAVVLEGSDGVFCSGGDLTFVKQIATADDGYVMCSFMGTVLRRLAALPIVSIAKIDGFALGGGSELTAACDVRIAHAAAKVGFVQGRMGVSPGWGGATFLTRALGHAKAVELLATAGVLPAEELKRIGYVSAVYDSEEAAGKEVDKYRKIPLEAVQAAKRVVRDVGEWSEGEVPEDLQKERAVFTTLWGGPLQKKALEVKPKHK